MQAAMDLAGPRHAPTPVAEWHEVQAPAPASIAALDVPAPDARPVIAQRAMSSEPAALEQSPAMPEPVRAEAERHPASALVAPAPARAAATPEPSTLTAMALPPASDLVMVETRFAAPAVDVEPASAPRPRRERRAPTTVADEPLQMVETRKDQPGA